MALKLSLLSWRKALVGVRMPNKRGGYLQQPDVMQERGRCQFLQLQRVELKGLSEDQCQGTGGEGMLAEHGVAGSILAQRHEHG